MRPRSPRPIVPRSLCGLGAALLLFGAVAGQHYSPRPAAEIVRDFRRVAMPSMSDGNTPEAIERFRRAIDEGCRAQGRFAAELLAGYPRHPELPELLRIRWAGMNNALGESAAVLEEGRAVAAGDPTPEVARVAWAAAARAALFAPGLTAPERLDLVLRGAREAAWDEDAGYQILEYVRLCATDPAEARDLVDRVAKKYAGSEWAGPEAERWRKQLDRIGTAHREEFDDFRTGARFDSDRATGLRIVHYFSPYSEGIEGEFAEIARLLERHRAAGLVAAGVHDGAPSDGVDRYARWLEEHRVSWPQRIALPAPGAKPWETGISVPQVPFALLIDREGKIRMVSTRIAALVPMLEGLTIPTPRRRERL